MKIHGLASDKRPKHQNIEGKAPRRAPDHQNIEGKARRRAPERQNIAAWARKCGGRPNCLAHTVASGATETMFFIENMWFSEQQLPKATTYKAKGAQTAPRAQKYKAKGAQKTTRNTKI